MSNSPAGCMVKQKRGIPVPFFVLGSVIVLSMVACQIAQSVTYSIIQPTLTSTFTQPPQTQSVLPSVTETEAPAETPETMLSLPTSSPTHPVSIPTCAIDVHAHLDTIGQQNTSALMQQTAKTAVTILDQVGIRKELVMPPPFSSHMPGYEFSLFPDVLQAYPERFNFLAGGGSLNPLLHASVESGQVSDETKQRFEEQARQIAANQAAGFGEITALHLSLYKGHPFMQAPPDHPLLLLLADISAETGLPIDLHMEAVPHDLPLPNDLAAPPNDAVLKANIAGLEILLDHNPKAKIVWAHAGWDNTSFRTVELMRGLLEKHPNLYMSIKISPREDGYADIPFDLDNGHLKPEWSALLNQFPDRFVIGSDVFYGQTDDPRANPMKKLRGAWRVLAELPADIAYQIACENPLQIYRITP